MILKDLFKRTLLTLGLTIKRYSIFGDHSALLARYLKRYDVDLVVDVGAHDGGFARVVRSGGYSGRIISLEPLADLYAGLEASAAADPLWDVVRCAIGDREGESTMNVARNMASSSFLAMMPTHTNAAPHAAFISQETVPVKRLDSLLNDRSGAADRVFVKSDTQGFERQVVASASGALEKIIGFHLEMSTVPLYEGESLMGDLMCELTRMGYVLVHLEPTFRDPESGDLLQMDGIYFRQGN